MQIARLEDKLHDLHGTDTNKLRRQQKSMRQHATALLAEARAAQAAANRLDGHAPVFSGDKASKEVRPRCPAAGPRAPRPCAWAARTMSGRALQAVKSLGALWLGALAAYYLRSAFKVRLLSAQRRAARGLQLRLHLSEAMLLSDAERLQLGRSMSRAVLALSLLSASVPLGVKASRRLRNLVLKNPRVVDEVKAALAVVEQRAAAMDAISDPGDGAAAQGTAVGSTQSATRATAELQHSSGSDELVHVSVDDAQSPTRISGGGAEGVAVLAGGGRGGVAEVAGKSAQGGGKVAEVSAEGVSGSGAVAHSMPEPPARRGWSFSSTKL